MFYSATTGGFYTREYHGGSIPNDAVEITPEQHAALLAGESLGRRIIADPDGFPMLQDIPAAPLVYSCSPWQIRKALNSQGLRQSVEDAVKASPDIELKDGWEFATVFRSDDPFVLSMGHALGKTAEETAILIQYAAAL